MPDFVKNAVTRAKEKVLAEGMGKNKGDKPGAGPGGNCICLTCGYKTPHSVNEPCNKKIWIVTEADRSATTILFPNEY